jgi:hypothetical protein
LDNRVDSYELGFYHTMVRRHHMRLLILCLFNTLPHRTILTSLTIFLRDALI